MLLHLLDNARKFTPAGGRVTVRAARANAELQISVSDTGTGVREIDLDRVFGKFERGTGHSAQTGQSGAGLGLSLVKSLIELHGGRVELSSPPNEGTTVVCRVPVKAGDIAGQAGPEPATA
ncbi:MAG: sensor histidine kinase [Kiloniellaceae bacterium]